MSTSRNAADGDGAYDLGLYRFLNRIGWPRTYLGRLILICAVAMSVPLFASLALVAFVFGQAQLDRATLFAAFAAGDVVGIGFLLIGLRMALEPVSMSVAALDAYRRDRRLPHLPSDYDDEPGRLMREIRRTILQAEMVHADLLHRAETDPLTEIANRRRFLRRSGEEFAAARQTAEPLSLIVLDIDRFKDINDTYGHPAGDMVLRLVAGFLARALRPRDSLARIGGEEFAILLPDTQLSEAVVIAEQLRHRITTLPMPALGGASVTASFGVTAAEGSEPDFEAMMQRADKALYDAKNGGRDCVAYRSSGADEADKGIVGQRFPGAMCGARPGARVANSDIAWFID